MFKENELKFLNMDPHFEFDAPKWFDLAHFALGDSLDANSSLNSSWFDHEHPLHESQHLLEDVDTDKASSSSGNNKKTVKKTQTTGCQGSNDSSKPSKKLPNKKSTLNSKKSLGVKSTIRVKRGDRGTCARDKKHTTETGGSGLVKEVKDMESGRKTPDGFDFSDGHIFTPPFSPIRTGSGPFSPTGERYTAAQSSTVLCSPQRVPCDPDNILPEYRPLLSPNHAVVMSPRSHKTSVAHQPSPIRGTLRAKAITKAAGKNPTGKRRLLPAVPINKNLERSRSPLSALGNCAKDEKNIAGSRLRKASVWGDSHGVSAPQGSSSPVTRNTRTDTAGEYHTDQEKKKLLSPLKESGAAEPSIEDLLKEHNRKVYKEKAKYNKHGRKVMGMKICTVPDVVDGNKEIDSEQTFSSTEINKKGTITKLEGDNKFHATKNGSLGVESPGDLKFKEVQVKTMPLPGGISHSITTLTAEIASGSNCEGVATDELSVQEMIEQHHRKVQSGKCKYDIHGRRIQSATPTFCPAPVSSSTRTKPISTTAKYARRSCVAAPVTSHASTLSTGRKRSANSTTNSTVLAKQKRRSCLETTTVTSNDAVSEISAAPSKSSLLSSSSTSTLPKSTAATDTKKLGRQKRRSCVILPVTSSVDLTDTEREIREMIARHNSRLAAKK